MSAFKVVSSAELDSACTVQFAQDSFVHGAVRLSPQGWIVRNVLPINFDAYGAVVTPWKTSDERGFHPPGTGNNFTGVAEAYCYFSREVPRPVTLDRWHDDFCVIEQEKTLPALFRSIMDRVSSHVQVIYVRCYADFDAVVFNWKIDRALFFALDDPFLEMPYPRTDFQIFPEGGGWFIHHHDTAPIMYLAASERVVAELAGLLHDQFIRLSLDDIYY